MADELEVLVFNFRQRNTQVNGGKSNLHGKSIEAVNLTITQAHQTVSSKPFSYPDMENDPFFDFHRLQRQRPRLGGGILPLDLKCLLMLMSEVLPEKTIVRGCNNR